MADLVSMRADAMEARKKIDGLLSIDGELSTDQVAQLEAADVEFRKLQGEIAKHEIVANAKESLAAPSYEFRGDSKPKARSEMDVRKQFRNDLIHELRHGPGSSLERRTITGGTGGAALDLMPVDLQDEMIRLLASRSSVMQAATVRTYANDVELPVVSARATITGFTDENAAYDEFDPTFNKLRIRAYKSAAQTIVTEEVLADSRGGAVNEILTQHAEAHAYFWETQYMSTVAAQNADAPDGLLQAETALAVVFPDDAGSAAITDITAGTGDAAISDVTYDNLLDVVFGMPAKYWNLAKSWLMSPAMFQHIIGLQDQQDRPLFLPQATGNISQTFGLGTLFGYPVYVSDAMTNATPAGTFQAVLLERGSYIVAQREGVASQVDPYRYGELGATAYRTRMRADGRWVRPSSSARLKLSSS